MFIVGLGALSQVALGRWPVSPWSVPDLTLVGMVLAMARTSGYSWKPALLGGLLAMLLAVQHPVVVGVAYVGAGWLVRRLAARWELADASIQLGAVGVAEAFLLGVWLLLDGPMTLSLLLLSGVRLFITVACLPLVRFLLRIASVPTRN